MKSGRGKRRKKPPKFRKSGWTIFRKILLGYRWEQLNQTDIAGKTKAEILKDRSRRLKAVEELRKFPSHQYEVGSLLALVAQGDKEPKVRNAALWALRDRGVNSLDGEMINLRNIEAKATLQLRKELRMLSEIGIDPIS